MEEFINGLREVYESKYTTEKGIIVFLLPIAVRYSNPPIGVKIEYLGAFSDDIFSSGRYIMLTKYHSNFRKETLVHEAAHTLGLFHSFQLKSIDKGRPILPIHTFEYKKTENIMDDSVHTLTFWKWQWKKIQLDLTDLEVVR